MLSNICQLKYYTVASPLLIRLNTFQRTSLSVTPLVRNIKLDATSIPSGSTVLQDASFVQSISAEWEKAKPFKKIPGPSRFQIMRGFMKGGEYEKLSFNDLMLTCRKKYGDTFLIPAVIGQPPMLATFSVNDFEKVHRTEGPYPERPGAESMVYYRERRKDGFFKETRGLIGNGKDWGQFRSAVNPVLMKPQNARLYLNPMLEVNADFVQRIREIRDPVTLEVPGNFFEDINRLTFESIAVVALDKRLDLILQRKDAIGAEELFECSRTFIKLMYDLNVKPSFYKYFPTPTYRRFKKTNDRIFDLCYKYVDEAIKRAETDNNVGEGRSVLEKLLKIDRKYALIMALDMLQAGVEPTSSLVSALMLLLAVNPEKQEKLREEIMNAVTQDGRAMPFSIENMRNLPYLRACVKEALRIYPVVGGNFRAAGMDIVLGGYRVPKGTRCVMNSNLLLSEERFFPRPQEFLPERWLRGPEANGLVAADLSAFIYLPFGFGPRTCVGKRIVDLEVELTIANLVRHFKFEYNYSTENAFECYFINVPAVPLKFKFMDL